jgi:hypothetical protein
MPSPVTSGVLTMFRTVALPQPLAAYSMSAPVADAAAVARLSRLTPLPVLLTMPSRSSSLLLEKVRYTRSATPSPLMSPTLTTSRVCTAPPTPRSAPA